jgi:hypothetical protein
MTPVHSDRHPTSWLVLLGFVFASAFSSDAMADPITIASTRVEFGIFQVEFPTQVRFYTKYQDTPAPGGLIPGPRVLDTVFARDTIPRTVRATATSDGDFRSFTRLLTNNQPDQIEFTYEPPSDRFGESFAFVPLDTNVFSVDWERFTVTSLSYTLDEFSFDTSRPFEIPGVGVLFPVVLSGVFEVQGTPVPEPSSVLLVGLAGASIAARAHRRKRRDSR